MNTANGPVQRIKIELLIVLLVTSAGCAGFGGGGYYDGSVEVSEPDFYLFGGEYYRGHDAHNYSHRGSESRGAAHQSSSRPASAVNQGTAHTGSRPAASQGSAHSSDKKGGR